MEMRRRKHAGDDTRRMRCWLSAMSKCSPSEVPYIAMAWYHHALRLSTTGTNMPYDVVPLSTGVPYIAIAW
eukprot:3260585-Rhodomonas_salina.9